MHKVSLAIAVLSTALPVLAQNCNGAPPSATIACRDPFSASFYYGNLTNSSYNLYFDAVLQSPVTITGMRATCYDQGAGNPVVPNQVGGTAPVNVYSIAGTRMGNEGSATGWTLLGTGTITVVAWAGESPITFTTPIAVPAGTFGFAIEVLPTTTGPLPGTGLHCLGVSPYPNVPITDSFWSITNEGIQQTAWVLGAGAVTAGTNIAGINLKMSYTPDPSAALWIQNGTGCYFRSRSVHENFPSPNAAPDLENTSITFLPTAGTAGPNYLLLPTGPAYVAPTGTPRNAVASAVVPPGYTVGTWDDALDAPFTLPFTFNFPGGSTNTITCGSNGIVYLASVTAGNHAYGYYGDMAGFRDHAPSIAGWWSDLDLQDSINVTGGSGNLVIEVDPGNTWVRASYHLAEEWTGAGVGVIASFSVTLYSSGQIELAYGDLNLGTGGNDALVGFTPGNGATLATAVDLSVVMQAGFSTGDGAIPPVLGMDARPVLGTTPNIVTSNITPGTVFEIFVASLGGVASPVSLAPYGMAGCDLHLNQAFIVAAFLTGIDIPSGTFIVPFAIPNDPSFQNVQFFFQAAPLTAGLNPAGILASNGLCAKLGL
ncbi:MAG: hypothetical protein Q7T30_04145 [Planctomycetota bacterium]|nr:hypothetical protein [Planctomycetota bacterium]